MKGDTVYVMTHEENDATVIDIYSEDSLLEFFRTQGYTGADDPDFKQNYTLNEDTIL